MVDSRTAAIIFQRRHSLLLLSWLVLVVRGGNEAATSMAAAVTTLGDLELRGNKPNHHHHGDESLFRYPHSAFDENGGSSCSYESYDEENTENIGPARMGGKNGGMARINLDLSGRVFCHLISRHKQSNGGVATGGRTTSSTVPLLFLAEPAAATIMLKPMENGKQQQQQQQYKNSASSPFAKSIATRRYINDVATYVTRRLELLLPHDIYIGTNYNFDEIWYGATRLITQCSWGPYYDILQRRRSGSSRGQLGIPWSSSSSSSLANKSFWTINVEKERNTFDRYDTTSRIRCVQQYPSSPSSSSSVTSPHTTTAASSRHISLEYDSAKLNTNIDNIDNGNDSTITMTADQKRSRSDNGQYHLAPTMSMHVKTPLFHPRLVAHVKKTWIINDDSTNGDSVNRRYSSILERYRNSIPKSIIVHPSTISGAAAAAVGGHEYKEKLSTWLENDGWKPQKMAVNLLGNIITRHEIGLISSTPPPTPTTTTPTLPLTKLNCRKSSITPSWHIIHDTGIRLSLSKKVDWSTMGIIFPWSTNNSVGGSGSRRHNNVGGSNSGGSSSMLGILQSTHARLELCGMYGASSSLPQQSHGMATGRMSIGVDVEPLDWSSTFRVTVCHEDVSFL